MKLRCAVCEIEIEDSQALTLLEEEGDVYPICGDRCLERFEQEPELFTIWAGDDDAPRESA